MDKEPESSLNPYELRARLEFLKEYIGDLDNIIVHKKAVIADIEKRILDYAETRKLLRSEEILIVSLDEYNEMRSETASLKSRLIEENQAVVSYTKQMQSLKHETQRVTMLLQKAPKPGEECEKVLKFQTQKTKKKK